MAMPNDADDRYTTHHDAHERLTGRPPILTGVEVMREGRAEPFLHAQPSLSSAAVRWSGLALENYLVPALVISRHEHVENFIHVVLRGSVKYEVSTRGKTLQFAASPGTTFILPRGTEDQLTWKGPTHRIAVAIHPRLLVSALDETAHESDTLLVYSENTWGRAPHGSSRKSKCVASSTAMMWGSIKFQCCTSSMWLRFVKPDSIPISVILDDNRPEGGFTCRAAVWGIPV